MNLRRLVAIATPVAAVGLLLTPLQVAADDDVARPTLHAPKSAKFVLGSSVSAAPNYGTGPGDTASIPMQFRWSAFDPSGICQYELGQVMAWGPRRNWTDTNLATSATVTTDDYIDQDGGGIFNIPAYSVRAWDCAGNKRVKDVRVSPAVFQEDGQSYGYGTVDVQYAGKWQLSYCDCWSGGMARKTSELNAYAQYALSVTARTPVALVMETAANRGQVLVELNGRDSIVDTYSSTTVHRRVVWTGRLSVGYNTIALHNMATPGRPRVDLDALMIGDYQNLESW